MDDVEDDARYPPNAYPQNSHHRHYSAHSQRPKPPSHPQFHRNFNDQEDEDEDEEESNSDGINNNNNDNNSAVNNSGHHHQPADYMEEGEDQEAVEDEDDDDDSSLESRGKRRKLDNFEFVPRKPPPVNPNSKPPAVKNSPPDWSEDSTFLLLDAWGDIFVKNGRKSLRFDEWSEVAKKVNQASRITRSDSQCRNRLDTLKKKYKKEKSRMAEHVNFKSDWVYFKKMDSLMLSAMPMPVAMKSSPVRLACGVDAGEYVFANSRVYLNRANAMDEMRDSPGDTGTDDCEGDEDDDESDGLPPTMSEKKGIARSRSRSGSGSLSSPSFRMLADSIQKFGEVYEKIESSKRQQMVELERMRKEFHRDLEVQKRQILERAQAEIARIRQEEGEEGEEEEEEEEEGMTGECDEDDEIDGSAENLSG